MAALLELNDLYKIYKEGDVETVALRGANLTVSPGEFVAITGRSGAGKSTLLNVIGGMAAPSAGRVILDGVDISRLNERERAVFRRTHIGVIFQTENLIPFLTAHENVMLPLQLAGHHDAATRARQLLDEMGLADRAHHKPAMLSGGERQRVAIAAALANEPQLLLADELTGELDSTTAGKIMALLACLNEAHTLTLLVVTHNPTIAARAARQVHIRDGALYDQEVRHG
jgi:putative ABC transport system ATP-binding protein